MAGIARARAATVGVTLVAMLIGGGALIRRALPAPIARRPVNGEALFQQVADLVRRRYVDSLDVAVLYRAAIDGGLLELGDPNSAYLPPEKLAQLKETTSGNYAGVGAEIDIRDGWLTVLAPLPGTPAERAGLEPGDRVISIDSQPTRGWSVEQASRAIRGSPGTVLRLGIERPGVGTTITVALEREMIHQQAVRRSVMLRGDIGYVDVAVFSEETAKELRDGIESLRRSGAHSIILDLRNNPGGLLDQGVAAADMFLGGGEKVVGLRGRTPEADHEIADSTPELWPDLRLIALVNGGSASSAEILAGALQDNDRAVLVGSTSFGKGSAQSLIGLQGGGALKLTTIRWFTPLGRSISKRTADTDSARTRTTPAATFRTPMGRVLVGGGGITPDVVVAAKPDTAAAAFARGLGEHSLAFRDAMTDLARSLRGAHAITSPAFTVTSDMLADLWRRMVARGITMDRTTYDRAAPVVSRALGAEIARFVLGGNAEFEWSARQDAALQRALDLTSGARSQAELFTRAAAAAAAASAPASAVAPAPP